MSDDWNLPPISLSTRCDQSDCNAAANVRVVLRAGDLYFCGHHYVEINMHIKPHAIYVHDERTRGPVLNRDVEIEPFGRLTPQRSLTSLDPVPLVRDPSRTAPRHVPQRNLRRARLQLLHLPALRRNRGRHVRLDQAIRRVTRFTAHRQSKGITA